MRFDFVELPGSPKGVPLAVVPVTIGGLDDAPQACLIDRGTIFNRLGGWLAEAAGVDLRGAPEDRVVVAGLNCTVRHARVSMRVGELELDAPVPFCDP